jgi:CheY-like chemotaxis protein
LLVCALEYDGYNITTLADGTQVVATLAALAEPCIVLMDLMMPRMDGWAVCRALADEPLLLARHALVLMSAAPLFERALPAEARAFVRKPFDLDALYRLLATLSAAPLAAPTVAPAVAPALG